MAILGKTLIGKEHFSSELRRVLGEEACKVYGREITRHSCRGGTDFQTKFDRVDDFKSELQPFHNS